MWVVRCSRWQPLFRGVFNLTCQPVFFDEPIHFGSRPPSGEKMARDRSQVLVVVCQHTYWSPKDPKAETHISILWFPKHRVVGTYRDGRKVGSHGNLAKSTEKCCAASLFILYIYIYGSYRMNKSNNLAFIFRLYELTL